MTSTLLAISLLGVSSITHATGCSDGSEPVKTVSSDGSYYTYKCNVSSAPVNSTEPGTVSLSSDVQKSTTTGNWFPDEVMYSPHYAKYSQQFRLKAWTSTHWQFADFDNDGIQDFFMITNPMQTGFDWSADSPECNTSIGTCFSDVGSFSLIKVSQMGQSFTGVEVTNDFFIDNNPI